MVEPCICVGETMAIRSTLESFRDHLVPRDDPSVLEFIEFLTNDNGRTLVSLEDVFFCRSQLGWIPELSCAMHTASTVKYGPTPEVMDMFQTLACKLSQVRDVDDDVWFCLSVGEVADEIERGDMRVSVRAFEFAEKTFGDDFPEFVELLRHHTIPKINYANP